MGNLYKESAKRKKIVPGGVPEVPQNEQKEEEVITPQAEEEKATEAAQVVPAAQEVEPVEETPTNEPAPITIDSFDAEIKKNNKKKQIKVNVSYTLSPAVANEIAIRAKKAGMTKASYLDELLKRVLGL